MNCELCMRYDITSEACDTRRMQARESRESILAPVCEACRDMIDSSGFVPKTECLYCSCESSDFLAPLLPEELERAKREHYRECDWLLEQVERAERAGAL
jgi:hypothetical protein